MPENSQYLLQKLQSNQIKWYKEWPTITVFSAAALIFAVSVYSCVAIGSQIRKASEDSKEFIEEYGIDIESLENSYIINIVIVFMSLLFLFYFLYKSIPFNSPYIYYLTSNVALLVFLGLLLAFTSYNISVLQPLTKNSSVINSVNGINIFLLVLSCLSICFMLYFTFKLGEKFKKAFPIKSNAAKSS
jgi:hypothetical protein